MISYVGEVKEAFGERASIRGNGDHPTKTRVKVVALEAIFGQRRGVRALLPFLGSAFVASIAYIDPGNYATNISAGAQYGYALLWVILVANLMAMLFQSMSAKLGIATGMNLAEMSRAYLPRSVIYALWLSQEVMAMATDLAEFLGTALGFNLLFGIPVLPSAILTGVAVFLILGLQRGGFRRIEALITVMVGTIALCYVAEMFIAKPDWGQVLHHTVIPSLPNTNAIVLAVGIVGATVMPHAIYLHSGLTQHRIVPRDEEDARRIFGFEVIDVIFAMVVAGLVNMAMLVMAAKVFHGTGHNEVGDIRMAFETLTPLLGPVSSVDFAISLLASGLSSSTVGTMAGQIVMQGFVGFSIPLWVRRLMTMLPALIVSAVGLDPTRVLVISQVVLSFALPVPVITLIVFAQNRTVMSSLVNRRSTTVAASLAAGLILILNGLLLYQMLGGQLPGAS
jgi:manganese transport protein